MHTCVLGQPPTRKGCRTPLLTHPDILDGREGTEGPNNLLQGHSSEVAEPGVGAMNHSATGSLLLPPWPPSGLLVSPTAQETSSLSSGSQRRPKLDSQHKWGSGEVNASPAPSDLRRPALASPYFPTRRSSLGGSLGGEAISQASKEKDNGKHLLIRAPAIPAGLTVLQVFVK